MAKKKVYNNYNVSKRHMLLYLPQQTAKMLRVMLSVDEITDFCMFLSIIVIITTITIIIISIIINISISMITTQRCKRSTYRLALNLLPRHGFCVKLIQILLPETVTRTSLFINSLKDIMIKNSSVQPEGTVGVLP